MKYSDFLGRSALGFGCMRFPTLDGKVNEPEAIKMIHYAIENGINYFDTAYFYHNGDSERVLGRALSGGLRDRVFLTSKLPIGDVKQESDFDRILNEQLNKLQTDHLDGYLLHGIGRNSWEGIKSLGIMENMEKAKADGRIRHIGFSFHDNFEGFKFLLDAYDKWELCLVQFNYTHVDDSQAGMKGVKLAGEKGIAIVVMGPLFGGKLARLHPNLVNELKSTGSDRTPTAWALDWLWSIPEVKIALSGMSSMEQLKDNIRIANEFVPLTEEEFDLAGRVREKINGVKSIPCPGCRYCEPCPQGVKIPDIFRIANEAEIYGIETAKSSYNGFVNGNDKKHSAAMCTSCGVCLKKCPQKINIPTELSKAHAILTA